MPGPHDKGWTTIVCAASGPSFDETQAELVDAARAAGRCRVLAVCTTGLTRLPRADALYASDRQWWNHYWPRQPDCIIGASEFHGELWTQDAATAKERGVRHVKLDRQGGLARDFGTINGGGNSGYQALGLAYLFGARQIVLVGYDMQQTRGLCHHHADHPGKMANPVPAAFINWAKRFWPLAEDLRSAGVVVTNCTKETALTCFKRAPLRETLDALP